MPVFPTFRVWTNCSHLCTMSWLTIRLWIKIFPRVRRNVRELPKRTRFGVFKLWWHMWASCTLVFSGITHSLTHSLQHLSQVHTRTRYGMCWNLRMYQTFREHALKCGYRTRNPSISSGCSKWVLRVSMVSHVEQQRVWASGGSETLGRHLFRSALLS